MGRAGCRSSATLVIPWSVCRVRLGAKVRPGVGVRAGHSVTDIDAGDHGSHAAQWLLVGEQLLEHLTERFGGLVVPAPQCHLGSGVQHGANAGEEPTPSKP